MNSRLDSHRSSSIKFALLQKGKSAFVKVSYESPSDMLLAQTAWQQVQQHYVNMVSALKCMNPPEWHKNSATLRLPEGHANAIPLLTAVAREFECCVHKQLARAEEKYPLVTTALPPQTVLSDTAPSSAPNPVPRRVPVPLRPAIACICASTGKCEFEVETLLAQQLERFTQPCDAIRATTEMLLQPTSSNPRGRRVPAAERRALILAPCELIKTAEAFGLQRLQRCYFPFQRQVVSVPPRTLTPSLSLSLSSFSPPDSTSPSSGSASASDPSLQPQSSPRSVQVPRAAPAQCAHERTALTSGVLLRVLCVCASAAAAARQLATPHHKHGVCRSLQFRWAEFVLRRIFWGSRRRIRVCSASHACDRALSPAHACCSKIWTLSKFVVTFSIYPLLIALVTFSFNCHFFSTHLARSLQREAASRIAMKGTNVHRACYRGDVELVEDYVIVDRSCLKQTDSYLGDDGTPFSHACSAGRLSVLEAIIALKADVNDTDVVGDALARASELGHLAVVEALLAMGIHVNSR